MIKLLEYDKKFKDVVHDLKVGKTPEGVITLHFTSKEKYLDIDENGSTNNGVIIHISSFHKDWQASLFIETENMYYSPVVIPLRHEYIISFIPETLCMNFDCLERVEWK